MEKNLPIPIRGKNFWNRRTREKKSSIDNLSEGNFQKSKKKSSINNFLVGKNKKSSIDGFLAGKNKKSFIDNFLVGK
jgi:hypothetical protein